MRALICGAGALPAAVVARLDRAPLICALEGFQPAGLKVDLWFRLETIGTLLHRLVQRGVDTVCFCGAIQRPGVNPLRLDRRTVPLVATLARAVRDGEDAALRAILGLFEARGMAVQGAHVLAPDLLPAQGVPTRAGVPDRVEGLVQVALRVSAEQGRADQGQSCVIRAGQVIAREDARGTDAMLRNMLTPPAAPTPTGDPDPFSSAMDAVGGMLDGAADWLSGPVGEARAMGAGGVFFKAPKPGQDHRVDLPTIGPDTARGVVTARLDGVVIEAGGVLVLDLPQVIDILDDAGVFLWVR